LHAVIHKLKVKNDALRRGIEFLLLESARALSIPRALLCIF